jgi:hypothetical protein
MSGIPLEESVGRADAIFSGTVVNVSPYTQQFPHFMTGKITTIKSNRIWKGANKDTFTVFSTNPNGGACGVDFKVGEKWIVYAYSSVPPLSLDYLVDHFTAPRMGTSSCSETKPLSNAKENLKALGVGVEPQGGHNWPVFIFVAGLVAGGLVLRVKRVKRA